MERLHFTQHIAASRDRVWNVLWNTDTYSEWTAPFGGGGRAESDWKEGSKVHFLSATGDGMVALIDHKNVPAFMSFTHKSALKDGQELPMDEATRVWSGAKEQYTLTERNGGTELTVDMDVVDEEVASFKKMFPEALAIVKELAER